MDDLIRRGDAIDLCEMAIDDSWEYDYATDRMFEIPAVDAVEVVRCRECGHYKPSKYNASTAHYCGVIDGFPKEDWFCADGQRKEDGGNGKHL
jgi:hypothetical protein